MNKYISQMLMALQANIEYLKQEGNDQLRIKNGNLLETIGSIYIYEFELEFFQDIDPDTEIDVRVRNQSVSGKVTAVSDRKIQLQLEENIGTSIAEAKLLVSSYYLLELLQEKLSKVSSGEQKLTSLAEKSFKLQEFSSSSDGNYNPPYHPKYPLNEFQTKAIQLVRGSEVSFIWGPPGTGKTQTIARLIESCINSNESVLLISHTNIATDGALLRTVDLLQETQDYKEGKILREGKIYLTDLKNDFPRVIPEVALESKGTPIRNEIESVSKRINELSVNVSYAENTIKNFEKLNDFESEKKQALTQIELLESKSNELNNLIPKYKENIKELEVKIAKCQKSNSLVRFLSGLNLENLVKEKGNNLIEIERAEQNIKSHQLRKEDCEERLEYLNKEIDSLRDQTKGLSYKESKKIIELHEEEVKNLYEQRNALNKQLEELSTQLILDAKVIATTLTKSYSSKIVLSRTYDCVILDEASMAPLPAVYFASGLAQKKVVIVGDFFQLPPIAKHKVLKDKHKTEQEFQQEEALVEKWLKSDIFNIAGIVSDIKSGNKPYWLEQLRMQFRMHPDIADLINHLVYAKYGKGFELISSDTVTYNGEKLLTAKPLEGAHLGIYDTSSIGSFPGRTDSGSYYNLYNALLAVQLAKEAVKNGYKTIGIISPFRPQANLIQKMVKDEGINKQVEADTVHKFQGGEKQVIIFDLTTSESTKLTDDQQVGGDDEKLFNVAFSRAKEKCIVIADIERVKKKHSSLSEFKDILDYCIKKGFPVIDAKDTVSGFGVKEQSEKWMMRINSIEDIAKETKNSDLFDETDFYSSFIKDLLNARNEVIIDSPYIASERVRTLMPIFKHLLNFGVKIIVMTRIPKEHDKAMRQQAEQIIKSFENEGIVVLPFVGYVHRKIAIIDRNILWEGSLNILSQRESHEIMRRFEGPATSEQMISFLKLDKNLGKMGECKIQRCESCKTPGSWYWTDKSRFGGVWTFCLTGMHKPGDKAKTSEEREEIKANLTKLRKMKKNYTADGVPICPEHELPMVKRKSRFGKEFWGCSKYPRCKILEKID